MLAPTSRFLVHGITIYLIGTFEGEYFTPPSQKLWYYMYEPMLMAAIQGREPFEYKERYDGGIMI